MSLRSQKASESSGLRLGEPLEPPSKSCVRRWRVAVMAISFTRFLGGLSKKVVEKNAELLRSLSFVTVDVEGSGDERVPVSTWILRVATLLQTDFKTGIPGDNVDLALRTKVFGANKYQKQPAKSFFSFVLEAFKDTIIIILLVCAVLSLGFGIKQQGLREGWYDGGSIIVAVILVVVVSAVSNYRQSKQFEELSHESSDIRVQVVRNGRHQPISIFELVVGDMVSLKIGDQIPADGLFVEGHSLKVDESSMTGESDHVEVNAKHNPFLLSGTKVTDGHGYMLVTAVGMNTAWGEMMSSVSRELNEETPLQARLSKLTSYIGKIGLSVAVLVLLVLLIRYFTGHTKAENGKSKFNGSKTKFDDVMNSVIEIIAAAVTIIVVAIPEGLPLAVTLTLAYSMKRMMKDHAMVRKLSACETMGSATIICTDKTGTLTLNEMKVTEFWLGKEPIESDIAHNVIRLLSEGVGLNTTGTVYKPNPTSVPEIYGSPTEKAILSWALNDLGLDIENQNKCKVPDGNEDVQAKLEETGLTWLGLVGLKDPCRPGVKQAVESCKKAGKGHVVAVTGDGTNDAPALKEADIGLSMGIQGTEVAKESSDIIILDDNFTSMATVLRWGRCVYNNIQKFIQFQLTVNVAALVINFIAAVSSGDVPLTAVQLLWVNLIMDTLGALALATEQPTDDLMDKPPVGRTEPLITKVMWRNLIAQALYQVAILLILQFKGISIFHVSDGVKDTLIFNTFVLCQIFNEFNARNLDKKNIFKGIHRNRLFLGIIGVTLVLQVVMVEFLQRFADTERLNWEQWGVCVGIAALSWPIAWVVKCIPVDKKLRTPSSTS
ncbi:Calcium-transporting ATPase 12, plasma membrane-type [Hibiscus syriacus]|uniref:P-type Ca(2+) transporter n=1 Tax=Hibiscus syriacus TaxID=106335 RepID=A0A6A2X729_HIBSY|nr:Calcium-transporting ATPase 12, plasma membrane-type [Hibiscus syriacus]